MENRIMMNSNRRRVIELGDKIYVRGIQDGVKLLEMMVENVKDMTELIGEIRYAGQRLDGLVNLFIRNHTQGWSIERPMRFYSGEPSARRKALRMALREATAAMNMRQAVAATPTHMPFPWETH